MCVIDFFLFLFKLAAKRRTQLTASFNGSLQLNSALKCSAKLYGEKYVTHDST